VWTIGPSFPTGKPEATEKTTPMTLQSMVLALNSLGMFIPFKKHYPRMTRNFRNNIEVFKP